MQNIKHVTVKDKRARYNRTEGAIVCDNGDYEIAFTFDEEWAGKDEKTARFIWNGAYLDKAFTGDTCPVPPITGAREVLVGVYAGDLCTTTPAAIPCLPSVKGESSQVQPEQIQVWREQAAESAARAEDSATEAAASAARSETAAAEAVASADRAARSETIAAEAATSAGSFASQVASHERRLTNIEQRIAAKALYTDSGLAFYKYIPANVCPYAQINYIGGMTAPRTDLEPFVKEDTWDIQLCYDTGEWERVAEIPQEIQDLEGYGYGINETVYNYIDLNTKEFVEMVKSFKFNGGENWQYVTEGGNPCFKLSSWVANNGVKQYANAISNFVKKAGGTTTLIDAFWISNKNLFVACSAYTDAASWKAFLAEQYAKGKPFTVLVELTTPIRTDISKWWNFDNIVDIRGYDYFYFSGMNELSPIPTSVTYMLREV